MDVSLSGGLGEYAIINMNGTADPTARGIDVKPDEADANTIVLTPYILGMTGYTLDSGHLKLDATVSMADGRIDAENTLFLRELHMEQASQERAEKAAAEAGMSIEKSLDMLRSKQGIFLWTYPFPVR